MLAAVPNMMQKGIRDLGVARLNICMYGYMILF